MSPGLELERVGRGPSAERGGVVAPVAAAPQRQPAGAGQPFGSLDAAPELIETGRARPSREMILHLAQRLELPLRERNRVLLAGGFAPAYPEHALEDTEMTLVRDALERFLAAHEPYPALVVDRHRTILASNRAVGMLTQGVAAELLEPPANALRIALHPDGMAPRIRNLDEWAGHLLGRLRRECEATFDPELDALHAELAAYHPASSRGAHESATGALALLHTLQLDDVELSFISTVTRFGTALDVTLAELTIEAFYPANSATAAALAAHARPPIAD